MDIEHAKKVAAAEEAVAAAEAARIQLAAADQAAIAAYRARCNAGFGGIAYGRPVEILNQTQAAADYARAITAAGRATAKVVLSHATKGS
jgi:hypothetical protein